MGKNFKKEGVVRKQDSRASKVKNWDESEYTQLEDYGPTEVNRKKYGHGQRRFNKRPAFSSFRSLPATVAPFFLHRTTLALPLGEDAKKNVETVLIRKLSKGSFWHWKDCNVNAFAFHGCISRAWDN